MPSTAGCHRAFELDGSPLVPTGEPGARVLTVNQVWAANSKAQNFFIKHAKIKFRSVRSVVEKVLAIVSVTMPVLK